MDVKREIEEMKRRQEEALRKSLGVQEKPAHPYSTPRPARKLSRDASREQALADEVARLEARLAKADAERRDPGVPEIHVYVPKVEHQIVVPPAEVKVDVVVQPAEVNLDVVE